jgi:hypothetical protein
MSLTHNLVTLNSSTPVKLTAEAIDPFYNRDVAVSMQNVDSSINIYIGGSNVTSSSYGFRLIPGGALSLDVSAGDDLYAIAASGTPSVAVILVQD